MRLLCDKPRYVSVYCGEQGGVTAQVREVAIVAAGTAAAPSSAWAVMHVGKDAGLCITSCLLLQPHVHGVTALTPGAATAAASIAADPCKLIVYLLLFLVLAVFAFWLILFLLLLLAGILLLHHSRDSTCCSPAQLLPDDWLHAGVAVCAFAVQLVWGAPDGRSARLCTSTTQLHLALPGWSCVACSWTGLSTGANLLLLLLLLFLHVSHPSSVVAAECPVGLAGCCL